MTLYTVQQALDLGLTLQPDTDCPLCGAETVYANLGRLVCVTCGMDRAPRPPCAYCGRPAQNRVQNISRRTRRVLTDDALCAEHVQQEITLGATGLSMTDINILPLEGAAHA
jgi:hypothetical protein